MGGYWTTSPGDRIREGYLRGDYGAEECARRLRVLAWVTAVLFPAGLLAAFCILRVLLYRTFYPWPLLLELAALVMPLGPVFAWAVDRFVEQPAFRRAERRLSGR